MKYDITHRDGKPYVMIPLHDYRTAIQKDIEAKAAEYFEEHRQKTYDIPEGVHPVRYFRAQQKLTQKALAEKAGISRTYLTEIETGAKRGSIDAMRKLSTALTVGVENLIQ